MQAINLDGGRLVWRESSLTNRRQLWAAIYYIWRDSSRIVNIADEEALP
jgi:hypothetical protein